MALTFWNFKKKEKKFEIKNEDSKKNIGNVDIWV